MVQIGDVVGLRNMPASQVSDEEIAREYQTLRWVLFPHELLVYELTLVFSPFLLPIPMSPLHPPARIVTFLPSRRFGSAEIYAVVPQLPPVLERYR